MNLTITGHQLDITDALRQFVNNRMSKLYRHSDELQKVHVVLNIEKKRQVATATVSVRGKKLFANTKGDSMYAAIDELSAKLHRQLMKYENKTQYFSRGKIHQEVLHD
jgi:putative sigma-54 modulation protein